jgi:protein SCO1/2/putative membrane protein
MVMSNRLKIATIILWSVVLLALAAAGIARFVILLPDGSGRVNINAFPIVNASLNGASGLFLLVGYVCVRTRKYVAHATMMIIAVITSTLFLASYLTFHGILVHRGVTLTPFPPSRIKPYYLVLLYSHMVLAAAILPLVAITLWRAGHRQWSRHRRIAVWTFPIWLYVSVTGVVIYWMLYHVAPTLRH